jgi:hypothetical protein
MSKQYNGHKNWNHWNVSLWINNEETLYRLAIDCLKSATNKQGAARGFMHCLASAGVKKTPDGAPYSVTSILAVLRGLEA